MPLITRAETERFDLPTPGEWVELRTRISKGEQDRITAAAFRQQTVLRFASGVAENVEVPIDLADALSATTRAALVVAIAAWSFPDPITPENIAALDPDSYDAIAERLDVLWGRRPETEKKAYAANGSTSL